MTSLRGLRWTSHEEVCETLDRFLDETTPGPDGELDYDTYLLRERAAVVLGSLADERHLPRFRRLLTSHREGYGTRTAALRLFVRFQQPVARAELYRVLELKVSVEEQDWPTDLVALIRLYPWSHVDPVVWDDILQWSPDGRAGALSVLLQTAPDHALTRKLYGHWLQFDRKVDRYQFWHYPKGRSVHWNTHILGLTRGWPETEAILDDYRDRPVSSMHGDVGSGWDYSFREGCASLVPELWHDEGEFLRAVQERPERFAGRVDTLDLPLPVLCDYLAPDEVLLRVEDAIREVGTKGEQRYGVHPWPPVSYWRALELLRKWPDDSAAPVFVNILRCPDLDSSVHERVWKVAWGRDWEREPEVMREAVRDWPLDHVSRRHAGQVILKLSENPQPQDRERFLWATRQRDMAEFRCLGIRALCRLGEASDEWDRMLAELIRDPDVAVRLAAAESLASRGDAYALELIRMLARQVRDDVVRAEAIRWLGENAPAEAVPYCRRVLLSSPSHVKKAIRSVCEDEAAYQLARIRGPEALTVLLEASLFYAPRWDTGHLRAFLMGAADANGELPAIHHRCRSNRPYAWRCC